MRSLLLTLLTLGCVMSAQAHYVWFDVDPAGTNKLYFGEYAENVKEKAGGRLDEIRQPQISRVGQPKKRLKVERGADFIRVLNTKPGEDLVMTESAHAVVDLSAHDIGIVKPMYYARRWSSGVPGQPITTLDIVPQGPGAFTVFFNGVPLPKAKVMIYAPNLWMREYQTDDQGRVTPETPWPGVYVLEVIHKEKAPGAFEGKTYQAIRHRATCSFPTKP